MRLRGKEIRKKINNRVSDRLLGIFPAACFFLGGRAYAPQTFKFHVGGMHRQTALSPIPHCGLWQGAKAAVQEGKRASGGCPQPAVPTGTSLKTKDWNLRKKEGGQPLSFIVLHFSFFISIALNFLFFFWFWHTPKPLFWGLCPHFPPLSTKKKENFCFFPCSSPSNLD